ncbi:asparagine synthase (glutamine-hydrolyzing) [Nitratidesulfovibrio vulgaris]|uniref:asparagine synthase (glutamine-hydrolyzing) n=1 Tax=Nitratidesulfovibrio vulgaris TaxID=881 RepID=UPI00230111E7|nr:asparagine synthase (glutamine-hydrolyzing) [Nitratidesulfovibrio vulgaris]WCB46377.1 asparagine synthase (glutamine-hydrolyzing) [Nitratidesulfovibrio vulgaris]
MCGIAGILNHDGSPVGRHELRRMTDAIAHRGPDGEGWHFDRGIGLGHRRLAIIDVTAAGAQPMHSADGRHTVVFNGEIYNFRELRRELEQLGCVFLSNSDTEVLLHAYAAWGTSFVSRLNGMFAFAIWDAREQTLFLARDRYGIKPIYYALRGRRLYFASEQKAILACPEITRRIDCEALLEYFTFQNIFTDRTLISGIRLFPAGHTALVRAGRPAHSLPLHEYWDFNFAEPETHGSEEEHVEELRRLFLQAVQRQLVSDVELGSYLSGGIDSGAITSVAAASLPYIKTFTCGFDLHSASGLELAFDERPKAELMSYKFKTEHYEMVLKAGDMERVLPRLAWHLEEPRVGQSYPNFYAHQLSSRFVKVVLSGTGGDELFGGYPWRYYRALVNDNFEDYIDKYYLFWQRLVPNSTLKKLFAPIWDEVSGVWTRDIFRDVFHRRHTEMCGSEEYVNHSLYFETKTFLHSLLIVEDKLSMAHGLECRVPFLDNDLVDFSMRTPVRMKLKNLENVVRVNENDPNKAQRFYEDHKDGKLLLRKVLASQVPQEIAEGRKQGFSAPDASWFKGDSISFVRQRLFNSKTRIFSLLDRDATLRIVLEHLEGMHNHRLFIWSLLNVDEWLNQYDPHL